MRISKILAISAAVMAIAASPTAATAATGQSGDISVLCNNAVDIGYTIWNPPGDTTVRGSGSWTRCDGTFSKIEIVLWKQIVGSWYTSAQILTFDPADFGAHKADVGKPCDGNRRWYTTIKAYNTAGDVIISKQSNQILANCA
ncbi:hypothetical protein [Sphaerisporangium perillae]|uniref:hypothetical protein n=1 Tax=Sphaerisporangium perillae TaxID=2935860 RepID=UPI00200C53AE|nr:hypothetical protein [Sphaerisporangium perillae]